MTAATICTSRSGADAAREAGYDVSDLLSRLELARGGTSGTDWFGAPLSALMQFLMSDHGVTLGVRLPDLQREIEQAIETLGPRSELLRMRIVFAHFAAAISTHVLNEERDLFPFVAELEAARPVSGPRLRIGQRVLRELVEHQSFRDALRRLRELVERLPAHQSVVTLRTSLRIFSNEVHQHMHLENNVLYPRAIEIENGLRRRAELTVPAPAFPELLDPAVE